MVLLVYWMFPKPLGGKKVGLSCIVYGIKYIVYRVFFCLLYLSVLSVCLWKPGGSDLSLSMKSMMRLSAEGGHE